MFFFDPAERTRAEAWTAKAPDLGHPGNLGPAAS